MAHVSAGHRHMRYAPAMLAPVPHAAAVARPAPIYTLGDNFVQASRSAVAESRVLIAAADRLLIRYDWHVRPLALACATMTRWKP